MQYTDTDQWPAEPVADEPSLAPPPAAPTAPAATAPAQASQLPAAAEPSAAAVSAPVATAAPVAEEPAPAEAPITSPIQTMLDSLANDLHGFIAVVLAHRTNATIFGASSKFPAFSNEAITASMVQWFASAQQSLEPMGGAELFGPCKSGHFDTEAATIHIRSVGSELGLLVVTDPPVHGGVVHATLDILDAYVATIESLVSA